VRSERWPARVELLDAVQDPGRAVDAEAALARAHAEAQAAADVVEVRRRAPRIVVLEPRARDQLALADELVVEQVRLLARSRAPIVYGSASSEPGRTTSCGRARPVVAELRAHRVDDVLAMSRTS
jgi:hypothetical protein